MELIERELRLWTEKVLDVAVDGFGGLPPCPYARRAWLDNKVAVFETDYLPFVLARQAFFDPESDTLEIVVWFNKEGLEIDEFNKWIDDHNEDCGGVWLMGFHPDAGDDALTPEFEGLTEKPYGLIFVQSLKHLVFASERLFKAGYYNQYPEKDMRFVLRRNEQCVA